MLLHHHRNVRRILPTLLFCCLIGSNCVAAEADRARQILTETAVRGGLIVHLGCGDGRLTAALGTGDAYLVHGLDADADNVARARLHVGELGLRGKMIVERYTGSRLPYIDNVVNLLVTENLGETTVGEVTRVLVPRGVAYVRQAGEWTKIVKPWPADIDEWTHYLHDASNNAVAHDKQVGPPKHLQWQCGPRWGRHHDHISSVSAMVTTRGRIFSIVDEGSRVSPQLPADWKLIARDAFNGVLLWKRPIERWHESLWPLKSGPANLPRRLVAVDETIYATLGIEAPVTALDAASGKTLRQYENTAGAEEIIYKDGLLLVLVNRTPPDLDADLADDPEQGKSRDHRTTYSPTMGRIWAGVRSRRWTHGDRVIRAFDADTGRPLWEKAGRVIPLTMAVDTEQVYYHDGERVVALQRTTGKPRWTSEPVPVWQGMEQRGLQSWFAPTLVVDDDMVLFAGGEKIHMSYVGWGSKDIGQDTMTAFSADSGKRLWTADHPFSGYNSPEDLFVARGKVWTGNTAQGGPGGRYTGRDPGTGEMVDDFPPTLNTYWFHHRCYRAKATDNYILSSRNGIEFVDLATGEWTINHWVRGGCLYGIMPAGGLIYAPPSPCACYPEARLPGFTVLAAARGEGRGAKDAEGQPPRLQKGPAYGQLPTPHSPLSTHSAWPAYRHDAARSGATSAEIPGKLRPDWETRLGGRLTPPVVADGRLFVAQVDRHVVHALDVASGKKLWSFAAAGRIDSPPTCDRGRLIFGSADGAVYCLRASDGALAWRFRAAPVDRRMVAFEQLESVWPVHGSVLVQDGVATAVAGRSMYLDGGLRLCRLDVDTGRLLSEKILDDRDPDTGENMQTHVQGLTMPVALPDVLSSDGEQLYMRSQTMDLLGNRIGLGPGKGGREHLFAAYGFTDDSYFHRSYWLYGNQFLGGCGGYTKNGRVRPGGRILVHNGDTVFGYGRKQPYYRWTSVMDYQLFAAVLPGSDADASTPPAARRAKKPARAGVEYRWTCDVPMTVRAMALAGNTLLIAGPDDPIDEDAAFQSFDAAATQQQLATWDAALKGRHGAKLRTVDAATGETRAEYRLDALPVFDGLIVAAGRVFISMTDGRVIALGR